MRIRRASCISWAMVILFAASGAAQEMPKPSAEHEHLKKWIGVWDAEVTMWMVPGQEPQKTQGVETTRMVGGFWLLSKFEGSMMGMPFEGQGVTGFDPVKGAYITGWVDSTNPGIYRGEMTFDSGKGEMSGWMVGPGPDGSPVKTRSVETWDGDDVRVLKMYESMDAAEPNMTIRYTRRK